MKCQCNIKSKTGFGHGAGMCALPAEAQWKRGRKKLWLCGQCNVSGDVFIKRAKNMPAEIFAWASVSEDQPPRIQALSYYREHLQPNLKHLKIRIVPVRWARGKGPKAEGW